MKDFDQERAARAAAPLSFKMGGEDFTVRSSVAPEALSGLDEINDKEAPLSRVFEVLDGVISQFLVAEDGPRWRELRARTEDAVGMQDISSLVKWLTEEAMGEVTGRPTSPPDDSSSGQASTGTSSTGGFSSPVVPAA